MVSNADQNWQAFLCVTWGDWRTRVSEEQTVNCCIVCMLCVTSERVIGDDSVTSSDRHVIKPSRTVQTRRRSSSTPVVAAVAAANDRPATLGWHRYAAPSLAHDCQIDRQTSPHTDTPAAAFCDSSFFLAQLKFCRISGFMYALIALWLTQRYSIRFVWY